MNRCSNSLICERGGFLLHQCGSAMNRRDRPMSLHNFALLLGPTSAAKIGFYRIRKSQRVTTSSTDRLILSISGPMLYADRRHICYRIKRSVHALKKYQARILILDKNALGRLKNVEERINQLSNSS
jgi:hypothetical protein